MGFISKLKSFLGIGQTEPRKPVAETTIPVESPADQPQVPESEPQAPEEPSVPTDRETQTDETVEQSDPRTGEPVQSIKGIGPSYADRLGDAGVHTVSDLADADPDTLAAETGISAARISSWIELANAS